MDRREVLAGIGITLTAFGGCAGPTGTARYDCADDELLHESDADLSSSAAWPSSQYDAANTGYNPDASGPRDGVELAWRYPACTEARSGAVVHDGTVGAGGLLVNGRTGDAVGGEWDGHASTPTFADGRLYVGAHDLLALDASTGEPDWTFETESDSGGLGAPAVVDGTVFAPGQFDDPTLYAVDAADGTERWRFDHDAEISVPPAVANETVFVVDEDSTIYALEAATGTIRWQESPTADVSRSTPVVADGTVYLGAFEGDLLAFDVEDGSIRWRRDLGSESLGTVAVADGTIFLASDQSVLALSASDGQEVWKQSIGPNLTGPPAVADGSIYVRGRQTLYAVDASDGTERWQFETREVQFHDYTNRGINAGIAVADGLLYVSTSPGDLYALTEAKP